MKRKTLTKLWPLLALFLVVIAFYATQSINREPAAAPDPEAEAGVNALEKAGVPAEEAAEKPEAWKPTGVEKNEAMAELEAMKKDLKETADAEAAEMVSVDELREETRGQRKIASVPSPAEEEALALKATEEEAREDFDESNY